MSMRTKEELGNELCKYCPLDDEDKGTHNYSNLPYFCSESGYCDTAYSYYQDECTETCITCGENIHPDEAEYILTTIDIEYGPVCHRCYEKRSS